MGQRLVLSVENKGEIIANVYYHWSAYTLSTVNIIRDFVSAITKAAKDEHLESITAGSDTEVLARVINALNADGATICFEDRELVGEELKALINDHALNDEPNRNDGLIAISRPQMDGNESWAEGDAHIFLDKGYADVSGVVFSSTLGDGDPESMRNMLEALSDDDDLTNIQDDEIPMLMKKYKGRIERIDVIPEYIAFEELDNACSALSSIKGFYFIASNGNPDVIYELIA